MYYNPLHPHCGPGNPVSPFPSNDAVDEVCRQHDIAYGMVENPYVTFSAADQEFIDDQSGDFIGNLIANSYYKPFFYGKRILAEVGLIPTESDALVSNVKRKRTEGPDDIAGPDNFGKVAASVDNAQNFGSMAYGRKRGRYSRAGRRGRFRRKRAKSNLGRIIRRVVKSAGLDPGHNTHTHRFANKFHLTADPNKSGFHSCTIFDKPGIHIALAAAKYVNNFSAGGVPEVDVMDKTAYLEDVTQPLHIKPTLIGWDYRIKMRNNSSLPCHVEVYKVVYKTNTADHPSKLVTDGIAKKYSASVTYPGISVRESEQLTSCCYVSKPMKLYFQQGQQATIKMGKSRCNIPCDIISLDEGTDNYLQGWTRGFIVKLHGVVAHSSAVVTDVGYAGAALDIICEGRSTWRTNLGASEIETSDLTNSTTEINGLNIAVFNLRDPAEELLVV